MATEDEEIIISRTGAPGARLSDVPLETDDRVLGTGRGSVTILSDDWNKPMSNDEADAFWSGRW